MIEESGRVITIENDVAWIEVQRKAVCDTCSVNKGCGTGVIAKVVGNKRFRIPVNNSINARVGDDVIVGISDDMLIKSSFAAYMTPLLMLFLGAWVGENVAHFIELSSSEGFSTIFGIGGLCAGFFWLRRFSNRIAKDGRYQPILLSRIDGQGEYNQQRVSYHENPLGNGLK